MPRLGETEKVPLVKPNAIFVVWFDEKAKEIQAEHFYMWNAELRRLMEKVDELKKAGTVFKVYAVWVGQWKSDLFEIDIEVLRKRIEKKKQSGH